MYYAKENFKNNDVCSNGNGIVGRMWKQQYPEYNKIYRGSPAETANLSGTKLVIGVESGSPNIEFYKNNVSEFEDETGITIEWVEIPHDNMHERFVQEAISQSGAIDIYDTDQPWIAEFASKGYLEPLGD